MYFCKQYHRAAQLITQAQLEEVQFFFIQCVCYFKIFVYF